MDDYVDQYFSSSSWSDLNVKERSSWVHGEPELLPSSLGVYQDDEDNSPVSMIGSNHNMECLAAHTTSLGVPQMNGENCGGISSKEMLNGSWGFGNLGLEFNAAVHSSGSLSLDSLKGLQVVSDMTQSQSFIERGNVICNGGESSEFQRSLTGLETRSPIPQLWHPQPYDDVLSSLQGENEKGIQDMQNSLYSSFPSDCPITKTMTGLPSMLQSSSPTPNNGCNGIGKPRVRARRGQATDPHSIAERLRREKIAERMKNLQELVPNSNKTDKASMLDEIIEYVKFLQLQVKVLSMSRLGGAGAIVPLITDGQAEGSNGLTLTPLEREGVDYSPSPEQVVFEQEVVKLMESNVTMAMQYLQSKGLCLMPISLAAAISNSKASSSSSSSSCPSFEGRKKFGVVQNSDNCSSSVGIHQLSSDGNFMIEKLNDTFKQEVHCQMN